MVYGISSNSGQLKAVWWTQTIKGRPQIQAWGKKQGWINSAIELSFKADSQKYDRGVCFQAVSDIQDMKFSTCWIQMTSFVGLFRPFRPIDNILEDKAFWAVKTVLFLRYCGTQNPVNSPLNKCHYSMFPSSLTEDSHPTREFKIVKVITEDMFFFSALVER